MKRATYSGLSPCARAVVDAVAAVYGIHPHNIIRCGNRSRAAFARSVAAYICRAELGMNLRELGQEFGMSNAGILYAMERVTKMVAACDVKTLAGVCAGEKAAEPFNGTVEAAE